MNSAFKSLKDPAKALSLLFGLPFAVTHVDQAVAGNKPNFIIIFTDDQGYNDLGCFGSDKIRTPRIDQMAKQGVRFTNFYAQTVCGPSRGALMTARYPVRIGDGWKTNPDEITVAEVLKKEGYATGCIGKWDMSRRLVKPGQMPNDQGFDYYFGTLGATDEGKVEFYRNRERSGGTSDMSSLTGMYTSEALSFIEKKKDVPFFLYLAHNMPHIKIDASAKFKGKSAGELYGDVIEEIDWSVGLILDKIKELGLAKNTYILFTSDNGPWKGKEQEFRGTHGGQLATGSAYPLRGGKASHFEGGFRVPAILWGGRTASGNVKDGIISTLDVLPTFAHLAGARIPADRPLDGFDQVNYITGKSNSSARTHFYYFIRNEIHAVRSGQWKLLLPNRLKSYDGFNNVLRDPKPVEPELYDLYNDIGEITNVADQHSEIVKQLTELAEKAPAEPLAVK
jgi:arylsulfatase A-like enzyme